MHFYLFNTYYVAWPSNKLLRCEELNLPQKGKELIKSEAQMNIEWKMCQINSTDYLPSIEDYATSILNTGGMRIVED